MQEIGVRKNIQAITPNERKQYFWCLKLLSIIPPFKANKSRYFYSLGTQGPNEKQPFNKIEPLCLYDELISSHATCCEHRSFFFGYYHRHLMFYFQVLLNYVHEVISETVQEFEKRFPEIYKEGTPELWTKFFAQYHQIAPKKKVMAHYWNPTNYNNRNDLVIPDELSDPKLLESGYQLDTLDHIFLKVRKHHHYEINAKYRWYNHKGQQHYDAVQRKKLISNLSPPPEGDNPGIIYYFYKGYIPTPEEKQLITGDLNPRNQKDFSSFLQVYRRFSTFDRYIFMPGSMKLSSSRNFAKFEDQQTRNNINLLALQEGEILANYGGRFDKNGKPHNMHYLNEAEIPKDYRGGAMVSYNTLLPHYQLGYALFHSSKDSFVKYLEYNGEDRRNNQASHAIMHNNMHFSLIDGLFSLTNLMFYPFHSWVDVQIEMKLRMCQTPAQAYKLFNFMTKMTNRQQFLDPLLNPDNQKKAFGDYPIIQWCDPRFVPQVARNRQLKQFDQKVQKCRELGLSKQNVITAFPSKDYYLTSSSRIRSSKELGEFYKTDYIPQNKERLVEFKGFETFDASYDIEIFQTTFENGKLENITKPLGELSSKIQPLYIPKYLTDMKDQVNRQGDYLKKFVSNYRKTLQKPRPQKYYIKLVEKGLLTLITYKSTVANGNYLIYASFKKLKEQLENKKYQLITTKQEFQVLFENPVCVLTLIIFGKSQHADKCVNCGQKKFNLVNMSEELLIRYKKLWGYVNKVLLKQVIADSEYPENNQINDKVDLNQIFQVEDMPNQFTFDYIRGAQEVLFDVYFITNSQIAQNFNLTLSLDILSVQQTKAVSVATKEISGEELDFVEVNYSKDQGFFSRHFEFFNLRDNGPLQRNDLDGLIYSNVTLQVFSNNKFFSINFPIKDYHEVIRYSVVIVDSGDKLTYKVTDADFDFKKKYYESGETSN